MSSNHKILIIDDEKQIRDTVAELLGEELDITPVLAENGEHALQLYKEHSPFKCIICDISMPVMDGVEFIKELRSLGDNTPFIFFTGYGNRELMNEAVKYGAYDFVDKPHLDDLFEIVGRAMAIGSKEKVSTDDLITEYSKNLADKK